mmetsp:Transcript_10114/g.41032  ORF Transcript_10114/g.41032 Transcript_10114/m.41032 type:complete len:169 (+) Transcript_10114:4822-5328(+)
MVKKRRYSKQRQRAHLKCQNKQLCTERHHQPSPSLPTKDITDHPRRAHPHVNPKSCATDAPDQVSTADIRTTLFKISRRAKSPMLPGSSKEAGDNAPHLTPRKRKNTPSNAATPPALAPAPTRNHLRAATAPQLAQHNYHAPTFIAPRVASADVTLLVVSSLGYSVFK